MSTQKPFEHWLILLAAFLLFLLVAENAHCDDRDLATRLDAAILHVCLYGLPHPDVKPRPRHPMVRDTEARRRLSVAIVDASKGLNVDPWLLLAIAYREGSFIGDTDGKIGERSTFQIVPAAAKYVRSKGYDGCTLDTLEGSAVCAAALLHLHEGDCGSVKGAVVKYATGSKCKATNKKLGWIAWDRPALADKLRGL